MKTNYQYKKNKINHEFIEKVDTYISLFYEKINENKKSSEQ